MVDIFFNRVATCSLTVYLKSTFIRMTKVANFCSLEYNKNKALENSDFWVA